MNTGDTNMNRFVTKVSCINITWLQILAEHNSNTIKAIFFIPFIRDYVRIVYALSKFSQHRVNASLDDDNAESAELL